MRELASIFHRSHRISSPSKAVASGSCQRLCFGCAARFINLARDSQRAQWPTDNHNKATVVRRKCSFTPKATALTENSRFSIDSISSIKQIDIGFEALYETNEGTLLEPLSRSKGAIPEYLSRRSESVMRLEAIHIH